MRQDRAFQQVSHLSILMYHSLDSSGSVVSVAPDRFQEQIRCLAEMGYRGISLSEAVSHKESRGQWPDRSVVLTFDDGYANFCDSAFPVLAQYGFTATLFIVTDHMGGHNNWGPPPTRLGTRPILSWQQAIELSAHGVEIGAHTKTHPDLRRIPPARVKDEMVSCRGEIEDRVQRRVLSFAYPFGRASQTAIEIATQNFQVSCNTSLQRATAEPLHQLPRVDMYYVRTADILRRLVRGQLDSYLAARRWMRLVRSGTFWGQ